MEPYYYYNKDLQKFANSNRKSMPKPEACLWKFALSKRQMLGYQFRRQRPIGPFIADFACLPLMLVIGVDGFSHQSEEAMIKDQKRTKYLEAFGFTVLRFSNWEVLNEIDKVNVCIADWIRANSVVGPPERNRDK